MQVSQQIKENTIREYVKPVTLSCFLFFFLLLRRNYDYAIIAITETFLHGRRAF